jgi:hypothetical protein
MNEGVCGKPENGWGAMKQSPEERKECRGWFHVAGTATSSTLETAMVREGKEGGNNVLRIEFKFRCHACHVGRAGPLIAGCDSYWFVKYAVHPMVPISLLVPIALLANRSLHFWRSIYHRGITFYSSTEKAPTEEYIIRHYVQLTVTYCRAPIINKYPFLVSPFQVSSFSPSLQSC